jgi:hypothetical protein
MRTAIPLIVLATGLGCSFATAPAHARARVFVASYGNDANPCTFGSPCKTFQQAVNVVDAGGEVTAIDSAGFGPISINKSVTITSPPGVEAGIVPTAGGDAVDVLVLSAGAVVLRGLTLNGAGIGSSGIVFDGLASLTVIDCVVQNFVLDGIGFYPAAASSLSISNTMAVNNGRNGIFVLPSGSGLVETVFNRVQASSNADSGIVLDGASSTGTLKGTIYESVAAENGGNGAGLGFFAFTATGKAPTTLMVFHSVSANNSQGLGAQGPGATLRLANSMITGNSAFSWGANSGGVLQSYSDNYIDGNGDGDPTPPTTARK